MPQHRQYVHVRACKRARFHSWSDGLMQDLEAKSKEVSELRTKLIELEKQAAAKAKDSSEAIQAKAKEAAALQAKVGEVAARSKVLLEAKVREIAMLQVGHLPSSARHGRPCMPQCNSAELMVDAAAACDRARGKWGGCRRSQWRYE